MAPAISQAGLDTESLYEIVNGERVEIPRKGVLAGTLATLLAGFINSFALPRKLGVAVVEVLFLLKEGGPSRRPDVAFVAQERWSGGVTLQQDPAVFHPIPRRIYVHRSPADVSVLSEAEELDGVTVIPGFRLKIGELFAAVDNLV